MKYVCDVCGYVYDEDKGEPDLGMESKNWDELQEE